MLWLRRIAQRYLRAKPIDIPKPQLRDLASEVLDRWLAAMDKLRRPKREDITDAPTLWGYGHKLYDPITLTGLQVKPIGYPYPLALSVVGRLDDPKPGRTYALGGSLSHRAYPGKKFLPYAIEIRFSPLISIAAYKANRQAAEREIYSILIHEFTHARDFTTEKYEGTRDLATEKTLDLYHNHPVEIRAYTQQIVDEVETYIRRYVEKDQDTWGLKDNPTSLINAALEVSPTWQRIQPDLTQENRRIILRNVGQRSVAQFEELVAEFGEG